MAAIAPDRHLAPAGYAQDPRQQLAAAFDLFNDLSRQLTESYAVMEARVGELDAELHSLAEQRLQELREKERLAARLQSLLALLPAGVMVLDGRGRVVESNPAARELLGDPLDGQLWRDVIGRAFAPRSDDGHEISLRNGRRVSLRTRSLEGQPGQLLLLTDLTETRELQQRLAHHERLSAMGQMVSSLAHQIRTPVATAMLYAGHLAEGGLAQAQAQRFAARILSRLTHLDRQVRDMLVFARGDIVLSDTVRSDALLAALAAAMEQPLAAAGLDCPCDNRAPGARVRCNAETVVGALMNLVANAIEALAAAPSTATPALELACSEEDGGLCFSIRDRGPGLPAGVAARVTEPFFTTKPQGTGLGLAVVGAVARAHGGAFTIETRAHGGTRARLWLPLWHEAAAAPGEEEGSG